MAIALRGLEPEVREAAEFTLQVARFFGIEPRITSTVRSFAKQLQLRQNFERCVRQGRFPSPPDCKFPANRPGDSSHNFGLSFDSVVRPDQQASWDAIRRWVGFRVPENDLIHAEVPEWRRFT